ncbi:MAG: RluA family pseudouridine synthase [Deltaproteobacteria bacterium]|nr:RluA family pseudouridine synthase [Deltaproteobacteria bacterium]
MSLQTRSWSVDIAATGERIDRHIAQRLANESISRGEVQRALEAGKVSVNDAPVKSSYRVRAGDRVVFECAAPAESSAAPQDIPLEILHEDDALLVLVKPAGMVVHPARGHADGTLVNAVLFHTQIEESEEVQGRPGIVHRLDKGTSGVMVVAKTARAREGLKAQFQTHTIVRVYDALVWGAPQCPLRIATLHGRHPKDRLRFSSKVAVGRAAVTHVELHQATARASWLRCRLETGRTHQIRMHLSELGYGLVGDPLYGKAPRDLAARVIGDDLGHQALHARVLGFIHPITQQELHFEREIPEDFELAWRRLVALDVTGG